MKYKGFIQMVVLIFLYGTLSSQSNTINFSISPIYGTSDINLVDSTFNAFDSTNLKITTLKFYISEIQFLKDDELILQEKNSFHLFDASKQDPFQIMIDNEENITFDQVKFNLGIDSTTNVSGVMGGDLDPIKGMYWTWQSGYINFKLEGNSKHCNTRNNEFVFHLGGYKKPNYCLQNLSFILKESNEIKLFIDLKAILDQVELTRTNHIMSPSKEAVVLSEIVANAFALKK